MAYINSSQIRVFPSVGRSNYDIESQLTNENNLSQIVRSLCRNRKSYVLSNQLASNEPFEFVIYGFYFKILNATDTIKTIRNSLKTAEETTDEQINKIKIWAGIKLYKNDESNNESNSYQLLQLANDEAADGNLHELDTGKPTDNPETSVFQGVVFDRTENEVRTALKTVGGVVDEDVYVLQLLGEGTSVPVRSLLHIKSSEILDGDTDNYINSVFTTNDLTCNNSIKSNGTLTVIGETTLNTLATSSNTSIGGTLTVSGATTLNTLFTESNASIKGTLGVTGDTTLSTLTATNTTVRETLNVTGETTLSALTASNTTISGALTVTGATTLNTLTASNTQITGTLNVVGDTTLASVNATFVSAPTFSGSLSGNATTATNFDSDRNFTFSGGDISGSATSSTGGYTIAASIIADHVTEAKIKNDAVTTNKIKNSSITASKIDNGAVTNDKIANETIKVEKLGFNLNMVLKVDMVGEDDNEHQTLTISIPTLNNK